jgi:hypothetical protein
MQGGRFRPDFLFEGGEHIASEAKAYAKPRVVAGGPLEPKIEAGIHYDQNADDFGIVRVPKQNDAEDHNYYFPRDIQRDPPTPGTTKSDSSYVIKYKGYKNAEFTVTVNDAKMTKRGSGDARDAEDPGDAWVDAGLTWLSEKPEPRPYAPHCGSVLGVGLQVGTQHRDLQQSLIIGPKDTGPDVYL